MTTSADRVQAYWDLKAALGPVDLEAPAYTQAEVLDRLPRWMVADFDCPRGPHEWLPRATSRGNHYEWCRHCNRMKRTVDEWPDTQRDPLEVIYDLQFRR